MVNYMNLSTKRLRQGVKHPARVLTAVAAYDGHDASILAINRSLRDAGLPMEVIYMGFNKKVEEITRAAVQEGADCVAVSSYNGGHNHFFPALVKSLRDAGSPAIVVGGGGGTIAGEDEKLIESQGVDKIYGVTWSLQGIADDIYQRAHLLDHPIDQEELVEAGRKGENWAVSRLLDLAELKVIYKEEKKTDSAEYAFINNTLESFVAAKGEDSDDEGKVVFVTGDGGAGKSTILDEMARRFTDDFKDERRCAVLSLDPTTTADGVMTALLGDRVRMNSIYNPTVFMRSMATRVPYANLSPALGDAISILKKAGFSLILVETPGTGQAGVDLTTHKPDIIIYVKTREFGSVNVQLQKDQTLKVADIVVLNKIDREGSHTVFEQIQTILKAQGKKQFLFATQAKLANDCGTMDLYLGLLDKLGEISKNYQPTKKDPFEELKYTGLVPHTRRNYLAQIVEAVRGYDAWVDKQLELARQDPEQLDDYCQQMLKGWAETWQEMTVGRAQKTGGSCQLDYLSFNGLQIPKVAFPDPRDKVETLRFLLEEGLPGQFPFGNGVFPLRKEAGYETTRQFAGLKLAEDTNGRFRFLSRGVDFPRLSTAFDGITLYGDDSITDPGAMGKIGEGGVSVDTIEDMKVLYSGFDFRKTSTSMTINGPAPIILAMYFNVVTDTMIETYLKESPGETLTDELAEEIRNEVYRIMRGTVQADILKEVQAQNECIFQMDFAIRLMGDVEQFFVDKGIKKFYSISISGYHIGEAGATPIQEMAYTITNGFTYLENFRARGMTVDQVAPNFSFFFRASHEMEWIALGPVLRKIWAIAVKDIYKGNKRSQLFKYHTQTSGRALQTQEWDTLNPVRQTLHSIIALLGNTNSLHVDSADEALTTPSEKYVRQATMIPNYLTLEAEFFKLQNFLSGSYGMRAINRTVQEALLQEMERIDQEGGVGPATEVGYQRSQIAEASCAYEHEIFRKERPIIGRNLFVHDSDAGALEAELVRPTQEDWDKQMNRTKAFMDQNKDEAPERLKRLQEVALSGGNVFEELLTTVRYATLGQISEALKEVGGRYSQTI
jgi:isobutyryl-CoA mutase